MYYIIKKYSKLLYLSVFLDRAWVKQEKKIKAILYIIYWLYHLNMLIYSTKIVNRIT
jgi:hypothetical protein